MNEEERKKYIQEETRKLEEEIKEFGEENIKLSLRFRFRMWRMFQKAKIKDIFRRILFKF